MKIWYQSASAYRHEPVWDEYGRTLEEQCRRVLRPDTELYVTGIPVMVRDIENWRALQYYQNAQTLANMQRAQREGYDAFVIGCTLDVGLYEGRCMLDIPVVGISESAYHMAMTQGRLFALITSSPAFNEIYGEQIDRYGVGARHLRGSYTVHASEEEIAQALTHPEALMDKVRGVASRAVGDGASVLLPGPAFLSTLAYRCGVTEVDGAPYLDTIAIAVKTAEAMADLRRAGVGPSRRIGVYARPTPQAQAQEMQRLAPAFRMP